MSSYQNAPLGGVNRENQSLLSNVHFKCCVLFSSPEEGIAIISKLSKQIYLKARYIYLTDKTQIARSAT